MALKGGGLWAKMTKMLSVSTFIVVFFFAFLKNALKGKIRIKVHIYYKRRFYCISLASAKHCLLFPHKCFWIFNVFFKVASFMDFQELYLEQHQL